MALTNYTQLQASVKAWSNRTDIDALIPDFIALAEVRIYAKFRAKLLTSDLSLPYLAAATSVSFPANFISAQSLYDTASGKTGRVEVVSADRFTELQVDPQLLNTSMTQVLVTGRELIFVTPPTQSGTIKGRYMTKEPALSVASTNYILTNYPSLYLFSSMMEVADYLKDDGMLAKYQGRFDAALEEANTQTPYVGERAYRSPRMTVV